MKSGPHNLITDIPGLLVGNADDTTLKSGSTVLFADKPFYAAVDVRGGAPGTRETDLLAPDKLVQRIDAISLSGGSAFGLDAASGVMQELHQAGRGFEVEDVRVPLVSAAIVFDLLNGGNKNWTDSPYKQLGRQAMLAASTEPFALGSHGAGSGANTANLKGGLGSASVVMPDGHLVGALVVVNARGSVVTPAAGGTGNVSEYFWASAFELGNEFGGRGLPAHLGTPALTDTSLSDTPGNTTIAIVATDAPMSVGQLKRLAVAAHDGIARAIVPAHTLFDGDLVFAVSTNDLATNSSVSTSAPQEAALGHAAALCLSRAVARGVYEATPAAGDILPCWRQLFT